MTPFDVMLRKPFCDRVQDYVWMPAKQALRDLDIEPNARHTVELYNIRI
ncbi:MAG: hypothetical protein Q8Q41_03450 [bacterium]|nr:hypothetical protein [bacterium]